MTEVNVDIHTTTELLGRIDERTQHLSKDMHTLVTKIDSHDTRLGNVEKAIVEFMPVKKVVLRGIAMILTAVLGAALMVILTRQAQDVNVIEDAVKKVMHSQTPQ